MLHLGSDTILPNVSSIISTNLPDRDGALCFLFPLALERISMQIWSEIISPTLPGAVSIFMPLSLDSLPFDVLFEVALYLGLEDAVHLSQTSRQLRELLHENTFCRQVTETRAPYTLEARLARNERVQYRDALLRIYRRKRAFAGASPFGACVVGVASDFAYSQGILCCLIGDTVRILKVHMPGKERLFTIRPVLGDNAEEDTATQDPTISLLNFNDGILAVYYEHSNRKVLIAIDVNKVEPRIIVSHTLESNNKLFVRHNSKYLYYGTHSATGSQEHTEWVLQGISLDDGFPISGSANIQLRDFAGSDIGSTVAFAVHEEYFYALSNQTSFGALEVDWTSFYHCVRFPLNDPGDFSRNKKIWRRQHKEGPINDSWTDLTLQVDDVSNQLMIVESRREWTNGGSKQFRTFYIHEVSVDQSAEEIRDEEGQIIERPLPLDDQFVRTLRDCDQANYAPDRERLPSRTHPEYGDPSDLAPSFMLSRTKYRSYNLVCKAFIDLVEDEKCCLLNDSGACLRLRIGSRREGPPPRFPTVSEGKSAVKRPPSSSLSDDSANYRPSSSSDNTTESHISYTYKPITLWPPSSTSAPFAMQVHKVMNARPPMREKGPRSSTRTEAIAVADERSLVYLVKAARPKSKDEELGMVVLISFDPEINVKAFSNGTDWAVKEPVSMRRCDSQQDGVV